MPYIRRPSCPRSRRGWLLTDTHLRDGLPPAGAGVALSRGTIRCRSVPSAYPLRRPTRTPARRSPSPVLAARPERQRQPVPLRYVAVAALDHEQIAAAFTTTPTMSPLPSPAPPRPPHEKPAHLTDRRVIFGLGEHGSVAADGEHGEGDEA